jgi:hypothetical protein
MWRSPNARKARRAESTSRWLRAHKIHRLLGIEVGGQDKADIVVDTQISVRGGVLCFFFCLPHSSTSNQSINQAESPFDCTVSMKLSTFPVPVPHQIAYNTRDCDPSRLIADIMIFSERGDVFWYRSAFLWLQRYTNFPMFFEGNMLAHDGFWVTFSFKNTSTEVTKIDSCKIYVPLGKINSFFKVRYKWLDIACDFLVRRGGAPLYR